MSKKKTNAEVYAELARKYQKPMERTFYVFLVIIIVYDFLSSSMMMFPFTAAIGNTLTKLLRFDLVEPVYGMVLNLRHLIAIPALFTIMFEAKGWGRKMVLAALLVIGWFYSVHWREIGDTMVFSSLLVIVACANRDIKKIVKIVMICGVSVIAVAFVLSRFGLIEDLTWTRPDNTFARHAFGMNYCTDLACHVMFLIFLYMFYQKGKLRWWEYAIILLLCLINVLFVDGRIALFCTLAAVGGCLVKTFLDKKNCRVPAGLMRLWGGALLAAFVIGAGIVFAADLFYSEDPGMWYNQSVSLGNRLWTNHVLFKELPVTLFGTYFLQVGWGGVSGPLDYYFWVDCSYSRVFAMYGIVAFGIYLALLTGIQLRLKKRGAYFAMFLMALVAIDCMMEHHMIEVSFNTFLLLAFADLDGFSRKGEKSPEAEGNTNDGKNKAIDTAE